MKRRNIARVDLDATDRVILNELQADGRVTNAALAEKIHLSPSACLRRVRRLEEAGVISGYTTLLNRASIGRSTTVFVEVSLTGQQEELLAEFEAEVGNCPEVMSCHLMAGIADYVLYVVADDVEDYERIHRTHLSRLPGVAQIRSSFSLRAICEKTVHELS